MSCSDFLLFKSLLFFLFITSLVCWICFRFVSCLSELKLDFLNFCFTHLLCHLLIPLISIPLLPRDLLELKEIQRSLPHANQPPDVITGRPGKQFLSAVPIVLLPLLSAGASPSGGGSGDGTQGGQANKPCYLSDAHNGNGSGWGPPSLTKQEQTKPARPSFPFPPRPVPFSTPASKSSLTPALPSTSTHMNPQSPKSNSPSPPSSPTSPYPSSYSNRPSTTSTSATHSYSNFPQPPQTQMQSQSRTSWTPPPSLNHLLPSLPIKPREKPKFEFITLLDPGARSNGSSGSPAATSGGADGVEGTATKVGQPELPVDPISTLPSGLIERESERDQSDDERGLEEENDHDLISVTSSCPSLCSTSCPSSCSASEAELDTDHEHDHEPDIDTGRRHYFLNGYPSRYAVDLDAKDWAGDGAANLLRSTRTTANSPFSLSFPPAFELGAGPLLDDGVDGYKTMKMKPELKKKKERKFILVNDMEIELDDSGSESESEDSVASSGRTMSTSTSTTREITTTTTTKTTTTEKTTTTTTTTVSSECSSSPRSIMSPVPVKSTLWDSHPPSPSSSASLITPPTTPPSGQVSRDGSHVNMLDNRPLHSPTSTSTASRGRMKAIQKIGHVVGSSTSRERSGSMSSDTSSGGSGGASPGRSVKSKLGSPVKLKSKVS